MCGRASSTDSEPADEASSDCLRQAIERDYAILVRRIGVLVYRICGRLRRDEVAERIKEVLNETVRRALQNAQKFDATRSPLAWLTGIALRVLQEQRRPRRAVVQSDLGDAAWRQALEDLCVADDGDMATIRLDLRQALARLDEAQRRIIQLRYFEGLDGEELALAVNAPTPGAARVRLARALQALREQFSAGGEASHD